MIKPAQAAPIRARPMFCMALFLAGLAVAAAPRVDKAVQEAVQAEKHIAHQRIQHERKDRVSDSDTHREYADQDAGQRKCQQDDGGN